MANIRITALPATGTALPTDVLPLDGATTRKIATSDLANSLRPFASQAEAEAGVDATKTMNPLTTKQAIAAQRPASAAGLDMLAATTVSDQRNLLDLGGAALLEVGDTAGTVAAGDDPRFGGIGAIASQAEAEAGVVNDKLMSPLRTKQAVDAQRPATAAGLAMLAALTAAAQTALLSPMVGDAGAGGTKGLAPAPPAGSAALGYYLDASGAYSFPVGLANGYNTRADAIAATVPVTVQHFEISGYATANDAPPATYARISTPSPAKAWHFQSADGAWWELRASPVYSKQLGAKGDNSTDDSVALQAWLDYAAAFNVNGVLSAGTYLVPTATLTLGTGVIIEGLGGKSTIKRTTDLDVPLISGTSLSDVSIRGIRLESTAGALSSSSHTVTTGVKVFAVTAGLNFANSGNIMVISTVNPTVILTGTVTSGAGTSSMTLNITAAQGPAGTYTSWVIIRNSGANTAIGYYSCTNCEMKDILVVGRFYVGLENREGAGGTIEGCTLTGIVNRPIYCQAAGAGSDDLTITRNRIFGNGITQYGISVFGSVGLVKNCNVINNRLSGIYFHGIGVGGLVSDCAVSANNLEGFGSSAYGILIERGNNLTPQGITVTGNTMNNVGTYGIYVVDCFYCSITGNRITSGVNGIYITQVNGATTCQFHTVTGNVMNALSGIGIDLVSTAASAVTDIAVNGNVMVGVGTGTGLSFNANTTRCASSGNTSLGFAVSYNYLGSGHGIGTNV